MSDNDGIHVSAIVELHQRCRFVLLDITASAKCSARLNNCRIFSGPRHFPKTPTSQPNNSIHPPSPNQPP